MKSANYSSWNGGQKTCVEYGRQLDVVRATGVHSSVQGFGSQDARKKSTCQTCRRTCAHQKSELPENTNTSYVFLFARANDKIERASILARSTQAPPSKREEAQHCHRLRAMCGNDRHVSPRAQHIVFEGVGSAMHVCKGNELHISPPTENPLAPLTRPVAS